MFYSDIQKGEKGIKKWLPSKKFAKATRGIFYASLTAMFVNFVNRGSDALIVGHLGKEAVSGVGIVEMALAFFWFLPASLFAVFLSNLSQSLNTNKTKHAQKIYDMSLFFAIALLMFGAVVIAVVKNPLINSQYHGNVEVKEAANTYIWFNYAFFISVSLTTVILAPLTATGKPKFGMFVSIQAIIVNATSSILLAYPAGLGVLGTGIGTLIASVTSLMLSVYLSHKYGHKGLKTSLFRIFSFKLSSLQYIKKTWFFFLSEMSRMIVVFFIPIVVNHFYGVEPGTYVWTIAMTFIFASYGATGAGTIMSQYVGKALGEGDTQKAVKTARVIWLMSTIRVLPFTLIYPILSFVLIPIIYPESKGTEMQLMAMIMVVAGGVIFVTLQSSMEIGYTSCMISGRPFISWFVDLSGNLFTITAISIVGLLTDNFWWVIGAYVIVNSYESLMFLNFGLRKSAYKSIKDSIHKSENESIS